MQELVEKFELQQYEKSPFLFGETIIPTYDIGKHLEKWVAKDSGQSITGVGYYVFYTVPNSERWHIRNITVAGASGSHTFSTIVYQQAGGYWMNLYHTADSVHVILNLSQDLVIEPQSILQIYFDGYTSTSTCHMYLNTKVEKIR